jgi:hypothetical protein
MRDFTVFESPARKQQPRPTAGTIQSVVMTPDPSVSVFPLRERKNLRLLGLPE